MRSSSGMLFCLVVVLTFSRAVGVKCAKMSSIYAWLFKAGRLVVRGIRAER